MTKEQIAKFLETATDEQVKALSAVVETPAATTEQPQVEKTVAVETPAAATTQPAAAAAQVKTPTFEEVLAAASQADRDAFNAGKAAGEVKRAETIKALKDTGRCSFSDTELASKTQSELEQLVKLAGTPKVDFSVAGASRVEGQQEIPAAPDLTAAVRAARGAKA